MYTKYKEELMSISRGVYASHAHLLQVVRYGVSGITGGLVQVAFLYVFVDWLTLWYINGVVLAFSISLVCTFVLQKFWTFQDYSVDSIKRQSYLYILIALGALMLNIVSMYTLVDLFHFWHIGAQVVVVLLVGTLTFLMNRMFTFKNHGIGHVEPIVPE